MPKKETKSSKRQSAITNAIKAYDPKDPIPQDELYKKLVLMGKNLPELDVDKTTLRKDIEKVMIREGLIWNV